MISNLINLIPRQRKKNKIILEKVKIRNKIKNEKKKKKN